MRVGAKNFQFLWVVDFPLFEWDEETQRYFARHHPFTSPKLSEVEKLESDPGSVRARAYDIVLNGLFNVGNGEAIFCGLGAIDLHIHIEPLRHAFGKDGAHLRQSGEDLLELRADLRNLIERWSLDFHANRRLDSR